MPNARRIPQGCNCLLLASMLLLGAAGGRGETAATLYARGYTALPAPQKVTLTGNDFSVVDGWQVVLDRGVKPDDVAVESLREDLLGRYHLKVGQGGGGRARPGVIHLATAPDSVSIGEATDREKAALAEQAYRLVLKPQSISITANAAEGLFYGVQTLLQLIRPSQGRLWLPEGEIVDWPDLQLRVIYWDDAHHLDHLDVLKNALRQAAFFKINGFSIKLEGHFQYKSAPAIVEPYAFSPAELQELTDYGLRYHVQLIPYLDGPAHIAFILKHPEYAKLREYPDSNYELCTANPDSVKLMQGMYQDLLDANKGVKYFLLSTDEPYFVGLANNAQCQEALRAQELGSVGKVLAEFITKTSNYLHDRGRTVIFWGEFPLKPDDIPSLPTHLVNGEVYGPEFDPVFKRHGIRQMVYVSTQGEDPFFPEYYILPPSEHFHSASWAYWHEPGEGRVPEMFEHISYTTARKQADFMGVFVAGWADAGLHPEAFWLGYATGPAPGWHAGSPDPRESMSTFYPLFYGHSVTNMGRVYQLMSQQAQFWFDSWETALSTARKPIWGDSDQIFNPPRPARDQTLSLPPVPSLPFLALDWDWGKENARRLELTAKFLADSDELLDLLRLNLGRVEFNRYNLEVFVSVANLCRQNLLMLQGLGRIDGLLKEAVGAAKRQEARQAVAALDRVMSTAEIVREQRNQALHDATETWYKTWFPRVPEANGRRYLDAVDDVKDHHPVRTVDMSYFVYRELILPFGDWVEKVRAIRNRYAEAHQLPTRNDAFDWKDTTTLLSQELAQEED